MPWGLSVHNRRVRTSTRVWTEQAVMVYNGFDQSWGIVLNFSCKGSKSVLLCRILLFLALNFQGKMLTQYKSHPPRKQNTKNYLEFSGLARGSDQASFSHDRRQAFRFFIFLYFCRSFHFIRDLGGLSISSLSGQLSKASKRLLKWTKIA